MGKVDWTEEASLWLRRIYRHIAQHDPDAAMRTVRAILAKAQLLSRFPELGQRYHQYADATSAFFDSAITGIAYLVKPGGHVDVLGVFHERLDLRRYLDR